LGEDEPRALSRRETTSFAVGETRGLEFPHFSHAASRGEMAAKELNIARPQLRISYRQEN
jgi:hypothetical protein